MAAEGLRGVRRRKKRPSTRSADAGECPVDLVDRDFAVTAPNMLWVADITYIPTARGWVYAAFVLNAYSREIVGWQVTNHMRASAYPRRVGHGPVGPATRQVRTSRG